MKSKEVAEFLSVHPHTVYRLLLVNGLPAVKLNGIGWRIDRKRLEGWIERQTQERERRWRRIIDWR